MQKLWIIIVSLIILSIPSVLRANDNNSDEVWFDITTKYIFSDRWQYNGDQGIRGSFSSNDFTLWYFRPSVSYQAYPGITVHGGVGLFQSFLGDNVDIIELRPWQGLRFAWPRLGDYVVTHYLRLEQRMNWLTEPRSDFDFKLRGRYQLGIKSPVYNILFDNGIFLTGSIEFFRNLEKSITENFNNRIRYDVGVGSKISEALRVELHYLHQDGRALEQDSFARDENIIRLRLFYKFN